MEWNREKVVGGIATGGQESLALTVRTLDHDIGRRIVDVLWTWISPIRFATSAKRWLLILSKVSRDDERSSANASEPR